MTRTQKIRWTGLSMNRTGRNETLRTNHLGLFIILKVEKSKFDLTFEYFWHVFFSEKQFLELVGHFRQIYP